MRDHPTGADFPGDAPETRSSPIPSTLPAPDPSTDVTRSETPAPEAPSGEVPAASVETPAPAAAAAPEVPAGEKPAAAPAAPAVKTFALDEPLALVENGPTWTRGQVIDGLKERHTLQGEADKWKSIFRVDASVAEQTWTPIIEAIQKRPEASGFLDEYLFSDPEKAEYLETCARYYDTQAPEAAAPARQPATAPGDPVLRQKVAALEQRDQQRERIAINERLNRETEYIRATYPFFNEDQGAWDALCGLAQSLNAQDVAKGRTSLEARGLLDALNMQRRTYDARMVHLRDQAAAQAAATNTAPPPEPARVLTPSSASPSGTRSTDTQRARSFKGDGDAAIEDWLTNPPAEFRG